MDRGIIINGDVIFIPLRNKYKQIVDYATADLEDYNILKDLSFHKYVSKQGKEYAHTSINNVVISMHILLYGKAHDGYIIDHRNSNILDNRKFNLRYATNQQKA